MQHLPTHPIVAPCGLHLLVDFYGATNLYDFAPAETVFRQAAESAGATVLDMRFHDFGQRAGYTGIAVLAESHISIHTWPETGYAAIDIFMCGDCNPQVAVKHLKEFFCPDQVDVSEVVRGKPNAGPVVS